MHAAQATQGTGTRVALGDVSGGEKTQVMVPVFFTPSPPDTKAGRLSLTISFNPKLVTFIRAEKGFLLEGSGGNFKADLQKESGASEQSLLQLEVFTEGEPKKPLREGLLLTLLFEINAGTPAGTTTPVNIEKLVISGLDAQSKPIEPLSSKNGTIEVLKPESVPYVACFFFTH